MTYGDLESANHATSNFIGRLNGLHSRLVCDGMSNVRTLFPGYSTMGHGVPNTVEDDSHIEDEYLMSHADGGPSWQPPTHGFSRGLESSLWRKAES